MISDISVAAAVGNSGNQRKSTPLVAQSLGSWVSVAAAVGNSV